jgi:DNA repair protein RecO (recombination protein O)
MTQSTQLISEGIVIRTQSFAENDIILRVLSRNQGKISLVARHARRSKKRFGTQLDLFDRGKFTFHKGRGELFNLDGFLPSAAFRRLREDLTRMTVGSVLCECFDFLIKEELDEAPSSFELLTSGLEAIEAAQEERKVYRAGYLAIHELLQNTGFVDSEQVAEPSAKALLGLLGKVEAINEQLLKSKSPLIALLQTVKRSG